MCMLTYYPQGVQPDLAALHNGAEFNQDGHGFAIVHDGRLVIRKGMDSDKVIANFKRLRAKLPNGPAIFHSRLSTAGSVRRSNCHPFHVDGDHRTVLAHNGILPQVMQPAKSDRRSDTRILAEDLVGLADLDDPGYVSEMESFIGKFNKIAVLTVNPRFTWSAKILNQDSGIWDDETWYSNGDFRDPYARYAARHAWVFGSTGKLTADGRWEDDTYVPPSIPDRCEYCTGELDQDYRYCKTCGTCADCLEEWTQCNCFAAPAHSKPLVTALPTSKGSGVGSPFKPTPCMNCGDPACDACPACWAAECDCTCPAPDGPAAESARAFMAADVTDAVAYATEVLASVNRQIESRSTTEGT